MTVLVIGVNGKDARAGWVRELLEALRTYPGDVPVRVEVQLSVGGAGVLEIGEGFSCDPTDPRLRARLDSLVGPDGVYSMLP